MGLSARDPALLKGGEGRRYDKDDSLCGGTLSAAATRNLFRKKDFIHNGRGCEKRGHILKEELHVCRAGDFFKMHLNGKGPICSFYD